MTVNDFLTMLRKRIFDTDRIEYTDAELIDYTNAAIVQHTTEMIAVGDPSLVVESGYLSYGDPLPERFGGWAGQYAMVAANGFVYPENGVVNARWFKFPKPVAALEDVMPYADQYTPRLLALAAAHALNRNEYDVSQDVQLAEAVNPQRVFGTNA
jgi:hypothetical protein